MYEIFWNSTGQFLKIYLKKNSYQVQFELISQVGWLSNWVYIFGGMAVVSLLHLRLSYNSGFSLEQPQLRFSKSSLWMLFINNKNNLGDSILQFLIGYGGSYSSGLFFRIPFMILLMQNILHFTSNWVPVRYKTIFFEYFIFSENCSCLWQSLKFKA